MFLIDNFPAMVGYTTSALLFIAVTLGIYRHLFHPLRIYPGPFLSGITQAYAGFFALKRRLHIQIYQWHSQYGSVVRVGPNRISFNTATALRDIYNGDRTTKASSYLVSTTNNIFTIFTAVDNMLHRQKRQIVGQALTDRSIRAFEPNLLEQLDICLSQIMEDSKSSTPVDMTKKSRRFALDVIALLAFGYDLNIQTKDDNRFMLKGMTFSNMRFNVFSQFPFLTNFYPEKFADKIFYEARNQYFGLLDKMIKTRMSQVKEEKQDFYSFVADSLKHSGRGGELWKEAIFFLIAGGDTAATAMCGTLFYLSRYPECYQKLADEVRSTFLSGQDIKTGPQLASCRYLRACLDESMRMTPPLASTLWRQQSPHDNEPLIIDGNVIPSGTSVGVNIYALHHNEEYYPEPFTYNPERWMNKETAPTAAFAPFLVGPRACAGKSLAYLETSCFIAKIIYYFDFTTAPGKLGELGGGKLAKTTSPAGPDEYLIEDVFTSRHQGPYLTFTPRDEARQDFGN
ncbi:cytochrome P450 [Xylariaceae sp. FL0255]|nr:cytochrome P450 [Xylariaceae sp. FL0255]